jgi:hypothetical protein
VPIQPHPQDNAEILIVVLVITGLAVKYWRIAVPVIIAAALTITIYGLIEGLTAFHRLIG